MATKKYTGYRIITEAFILLALTTYKFAPIELIPKLENRQAQLDILIYFGIFLFSLRLTIRILGWWYRKQKKMQPDQNDNVIYGLSNLYILLIFSAGVLTVLALMGINYQEIFTSLSIVAAAIAIISKDFITEIISGFLISFSRQINNNDYVKIGEHKGKIIDINLAKTSLINEDDDIIILPNFKVFSNEIINYTQREIKKINMEFEVMLDAIDSVEHLEEAIIESLTEFQDFIQRDSYHLKIVQIKKDYLVMKFQYVLHQVDREMERKIRRQAARQVVRITKTKLAQNQISSSQQEEM